jgi:tetratricopeptide (TPR) repeat protein
MASKAREDKDWFRNARWNSEIESKFFEKLHRARDKAQYLKIQAACLAKSHPRVALDLLDKFFALGDSLFIPDAHVAAANAYVVLGRTSEAVDSYHKALERERLHPGYRTTAWSEFVLLVADRRMKAQFDEALRVLADNKRDLIFPNLMFAWHAAFALVQSERGEQAVAKEHAFKALEAAKMGHSGFRYHPTVGLVGIEHNGIKRKLRRLTRSILWRSLVPWR